MYKAGSAACSDFDDTQRSDKKGISNSKPNSPVKLVMQTNFQFNSTATVDAGSVPQGTEDQLNQGVTSKSMGVGGFMNVN